MMQSTGRDRRLSRTIRDKMLLCTDVVINVNIADLGDKTAFIIAVRHSEWKNNMQKRPCSGCKTHFKFKIDMSNRKYGINICVYNLVLRL